MFQVCLEYYVVILFDDCGGLSGGCVCRVRRLLSVGVRAWAGMCVPSCSLLSCWHRDRRRRWSLCRRRAFGVVLNCIMKGNEMLLLYIIYHYLLLLL